MATMDLGELISRYPYMASPAALAAADMGEKFQLPRHLEYLNRELLELAFGSTMRLMVNMAFQHGKSLLSSVYAPAWLLLWNPDTRILLVGNEEEFAIGFGSKVKDIVAKWGAPHGVKLKSDSRAKGWWQVAGREGGMVCKGPHGSVVGRPADVVILDDLIRGPEDALSKQIMDMRWEWVKTAIYGRLRKDTKLAIVNTRWTKNDACGRLLAMAKRTGEVWRVVKFKAIATEGDILGRKPGDALWPEQVTLAQLQIAQKEMGRWWHAAWQQEPKEEEGAHFKTGRWPRYTEMENGWYLPISGVNKVVKREDVCVIISVDWAASERKNSDFTCIGVYGLALDGRLMVLEIINERFPLERSVPELAKICEKWRPQLVAVESGGFQTAMAIECRKHRAIPEPRQMKPYGKTKLQRALHAITLGEGGQIYLPGPDGKEPAWFDTFDDQIASFTGENDDHDDIVDSLAMAATQCQHLIPMANLVTQPPLMLTPGFAPPDGSMSGGDFFV